MMNVGKSEIELNRLYFLGVHGQAKSFEKEKELTTRIVYIYYLFFLIKFSNPRN